MNGQDQNGQGVTASGKALLTRAPRGPLTQANIDADMRILVGYYVKMGYSQLQVGQLLRLPRSKVREYLGPEPNLDADQPPIEEPDESSSAKLTRAELSDLTSEYGHVPEASAWLSTLTV